MLTSDQANIVAEQLLTAERQASDRATANATANSAGLSFSSSLVLTIFALVMCGLIFFTWFFFARHWGSSGWRALGAMTSVLPCFYVIAVSLRRRRLRAGQYGRCSD